MRVGRLLILTVAVLALAACRREGPTITGSYGNSVLAGSVVLDGIGGSPEGVEVSVRDTGMSATLGADGRFVFSGVPENAILDFRRADGIQASLEVAGSGSSILVELGRNAAGKGSRGNKNKDKREFEGTIKSASAAEIVVLTSRKEEILIGLTAETVIRKGSTTLTAADLQPGMRVHVRARKAGDKYTAQFVIVQEGEDDGGDDDRPAVRQYEGTVVRASTTELVIFDSHKTEVKFTLNGDTEIRKGNLKIAPADLLSGQRVHVKATVAGDGTATAVQVIVQNTQTRDTVTVGGTVLGVAGADITVKTKSGDVVVQTNATTRIRKQGKTIAVGDIAAGDSLLAKGRKVSDTTVLASEVEVRGKNGHP